MIKDKKIVMIVAASSAISYKKQNPSSETEEVIKHVLKNINTSKNLKLFGIAAANFVLKHLQTNTRITEKEVMQKLSDETPNILISIEKQE